LRAELERLRPAEIIYPAAAEKLAAIAGGQSAVLNPYEDWVFAPETAQFTVREHFKVAALDGFGLKGRPAAVGAAGAVIHYLTQHLRRDVSALTRLSFYQRSDFMALDSVSLRNLEILEPRHAGSPRQACLYGALNRTVTPDGRPAVARLAQPTAGGRRPHRAPPRGRLGLWVENPPRWMISGANWARCATWNEPWAASAPARAMAAICWPCASGWKKFPPLKETLARLRTPRAPVRVARHPGGIAAPPGLMDELAAQLAEGAGPCSS
jgi:hypothetical protein